ncbi:MAG: 30S ribosomal protein S6 [Firmicutes bacterium]|nr:30S ribosomal protein S6 [Bacillota bacterium]
MGLYEIMMIIRTDLEANEQEEAVSGLTAVIAKQGGTVSTVLDWRKRKLSYEINKLREGQYYLVYFSGDGAIIPELEHYFRVTDAVIRYMVVAIDEKDFEAAADKAAAEAAAVDTLQEEEAVTEETEVLATGTDERTDTEDEEAEDEEAETVAEGEDETEDASADAEQQEAEAEPEEEKPAE